MSSRDCRNARDRGRRERGASLAVEAVLVIPVLVMVLAAMVAGWRIWSARADVRQAARASSRAATLEISASAAQQRARSVADAQLADVACDQRAITVDTSQFARPGGQSAEVRVTLHCRVPLSDLLVPGLPGSVDASGVGVSVLDRFRERRP